MKSITALTWKEYNHTRWFIFLGLILFIIFPFLDALYSYKHYLGFNSFLPSLASFFFVSSFAVLLAIAVTTADLRNKLDTFWLSRPINPLKLIAVKYIFALIIVLIVHCLPLIIQLFFWELSTPRNVVYFDTASLLYVNTFTVIIIYSTAFLFGCLSRKPVYATMLAVVASLLIYFLPLLFPPLRFLYFSELMQSDPFGIACATPELVGCCGSSRTSALPSSFHLLNIPFTTLTIYFTTNWLIYVALALASCPIAIFLSSIAIKRDYRVNLDQKTIFWSLGIIVLLLWSTVAYQLGSNLTCLRKIPLGNEYFIDPLAVSPQKIAEAEQDHLSTNKSAGYDGHIGAKFDAQGRITAIRVPSGRFIEQLIVSPVTGKAYFQYNNNFQPRQELHWLINEDNALISGVNAQRSTNEFLCSIALNQPNSVVHIDAALPVTSNFSKAFLPTEENTYTYLYPVLWPLNEPDIFFCRRLEWNTDSTYSLYLCTFAISPDTVRPAIINKLDITPYLEPSFQHNPPLIAKDYKPSYSSTQEVISSNYRIFLYNKSIYMGYRAKYLAIDITSPTQPELVIAYNYRHGMFFSETQNSLPRFGLGLENFTPEDDINIAIGFGFSSWSPVSFDGKHIVKANQQGIFVFEISDITDSRVTFKMVAHRSPTPLELLIGSYISEFFIKDNQVTILSDGSITVFDISNLPKIKKVGHYATKYGIKNIAPMPDGNILALTSPGFQIIAPPPSAPVRTD